MARVEYFDLTEKQANAFELLTDTLSDATGEEFEADDQYVYTEAIGAWGEDVAWEVVEALEEEIGVSVTWDFKMECGALAILFSNAEEEATL